MSAQDLLPLSEWGNFYVITGSAGAGLTGLQFVVIALRTEAVSEGGEPAVRAFGSPTVLHFGAVLLVSALLSAPRQTAATLAPCIVAIELAGLVRSLWIVVQARRQRSYTPVPSDWAWHVAMPVAAYAALAVAGVVLLLRPVAALDLVAATSLLLLFVGIRNAWDSAVWIASKGP